MTCAACAARVEKKLATMDNVSASVNFATEKATVTAPAAVLVRQLIETVEQAGYGTEQRVPAGGLRAGQRFVVRPGETIAADGEVLFGQSAVDRSMMTGESVPAEGDSVTAGTVAVSGRLIVRAARVGKDTQLAHLVALVGQGQAEKASVQRVADRISGVFVPVVLALAGLTLAGWLVAGAPAPRAFGAALAVLIIACPCALGLATPAALVVACGRGAQLGIFIKGYQALESSRSVDTVVLDKTGTLTSG
jgi:Cu+-exporting ATPase